MAAVAGADEPVDVVMFFQAADEEKAEAIKAALGTDLRVLNNELGGLQNCQCVVFVVTENCTGRVYDNPVHSLNSIGAANRPKIIAVKYCSDREYEDVFTESDCEVRRIDQSYQDVAAQVIKQVEIKKQCYVSMACQHKALEIVRAAVKALIKHFKIDKQMEELHEKMTAKINQELDKDENVAELRSKPVSSCDSGFRCHMCVLWIRELTKGLYWFGDSAPGSRSIQKMYTKENIHQLFDERKGYLQLSSAFLTQQQRQHENRRASDFNSISEYLDPQGICFLLENCAVFKIVDRKRITQVRKARNWAAHSSVDISVTNQEERIANISEVVEESLYGLCSRSVCKTLIREIEEIRGKENDLPLEELLKIVKSQIDESNQQSKRYETVLQDVKDILKEGAFGGEGSSNVQVVGDTNTNTQVVTSHNFDVTQQGGILEIKHVHYHY